MLSFEEFYNINEARIAGPSLMSYLTDPKSSRQINIYRENLAPNARTPRFGRYYINTSKHADSDKDVGIIFSSKQAMPPYLQKLAKNAAAYINCDAADRTNMFHLFRFRHEVEPQVLSDLANTLSRFAVNKLAANIKTFVDSYTGDKQSLKIACPHSNSEFNNMIISRLKNVAPIVIIEKITIGSVAPDQLFPRETDTSTKEGAKREYIRHIYALYRRSHPEELTSTFSRERLARRLQEFDADVIKDRAKFDPQVRRVVLDGAAFDLTAADLNDIRKQGFHRFSDAIKKTRVQPFTTTNIQSGDRVILFDDNFSTGFTETKLKELVTKLGGVVVNTMYGLQVLTPE